MKKIILLSLISFIPLSTFADEFSLSVGEDQVDIFEFLDQGATQGEKLKDSDVFKKAFEGPYQEAKFVNECYVLEGNEDSVSCRESFEKVFKDPYWNVVKREESGSDVFYKFEKTVTGSNQVSCTVVVDIEHEDSTGRLLTVFADYSVNCNHARYWM